MFLPTRCLVVAKMASCTEEPTNRLGVSDGCPTSPYAHILLREEGEVGCERRHDIAIIMLEAKACEARHRPLYRRLSQETKEANHCKTAVVDLHDQATGLVLLRPVSEELEWV